MTPLNSKQRSTLERIFGNPTACDIRFAEVENLCIALGAVISTKGRTSGSRIRIIIDGNYLNLHEPHPSPVLSKATIKDLRNYFERIGIIP